MEVIANGHEIDHNHDHGNFIAGNNPVPNGELQAGNENGFAIVDQNSNNSSKEVNLTLSPWQSVLFPLILKIVHLILRITITLSLLVKRLQKKTVTNWLYRKVCDEKDKMVAILFNEGKSLKDEVRKVSLKTSEQKFFDRLRVLSDSTFKKKPSHIAFALSEANNFSIRDIANLIAWSVNLGINSVSLYDIDGKLKIHTNAINSELLKKLPKNILKSHPILWNTHGHRKLNESRNQIQPDEMLLQKHQSSEDMIKIDVLDKENGQGDFTDMTQSIAQKVKSGELSVEAIDDQFIDHILRRNLGFKDPDLLIRFGLTSSNLGFLPWHIRLTEIHDIPTHLDVECWDLFVVLLRYSKCEQRTSCQRISKMTATLEGYLNRMVSIITADGRNFVGTLKGFDQTVNLILDDTHERVFSSSNGVEQVVLGLHIVRGDNIAVIGEIDEEIDKRLDLKNVRAEPITSIVH